MTPNELKRLSRSDLLEMLLELSRENDMLRKENTKLRHQLNDRIITIENSGSLAEAALQLSGVFEAAQAACEQYIHNIQSRSENMEQYCARLEQQTREKCDKMLAAAQQEAQKYLDAARQSLAEQNETYAWVTELLDDGETL